MKADDSRKQCSGSSGKAPDEADIKYTDPLHRPIQTQDDKFEFQLKRAASRYVTVEIPVALTCLTYQLISTMKAEYLHDRISVKYNHSLVKNNSASSTCGTNSTSNQSHIDDAIQAETATWLLYLGLAYAVPGVFMAIFVGSLSDRFGRKPAFCLNITGYCLLSVVYLGIVYFQAPMEYLLIGDFISGATGGQALLLSTGVAYIADVTSVKSRTTRVVTLETIFFVGMGVGQISLGVALQYSPDQSFHKYIAPVCLALGCSVMSLAYVALPKILIETVDRKKARNDVGVKEFISGVVDILRINTNDRRLKVIMYTIVMICIIITARVQTQLVVVYALGVPFCLSPLMVSVMNIVGIAIQSIGMIFCAALLSRILSENSILQLSFINTTVLFLIIALAQRGYQLFIGSGVGLFNAICFPVIRSQLSKLAREDEKGLMLAFVGCMDSIGTLLTPIIANNIYSATVSFYPPLVFFFTSAFQIIPATCVGVLQCRQTEESKYNVVNHVDNEEQDKAS
ncbi:proton-coupled folate transporter-like [Lytechinus pictus]|uniref:proton-coupled folate transporter-like n=1 Tax=Lytechinus pictus TaxID=7653 RepID=UPI0030B9BA93